MLWVILFPVGIQYRYQFQYIPKILASLTVSMNIKNHVGTFSIDTTNNAPTLSKEFKREKREKILHFFVEVL